MTITTHRAPAVLPTKPRRRDVRDAARLLAVQSERGNPVADTLTASLHRAGYDMRPDGDPFLRWEWLLLAIAALVVAAAVALGALWIGMHR